MTATPGEAVPGRIAIEPVTRIEGHAKITIRLDPTGRVEQARFHVVEFRGFERFVQGRLYWEVPMIVQRLCGICPVSHHLCAAKALDRIVGVDRLTPTAEKVRRLMHYGQVFQSHATHFFYLASPDLVFGFDAAPEKRNVVAVAKELPGLALQGIRMRKWGQEIIRATGGKRIHPTAAIAGGVNRNVPAAEAAALREELGLMVQWSQEALELFKRIYRDNLARLAGFGSFESNFVCLVRPDGALDMYDGLLRAVDADGRRILDQVHPDEYRVHFQEEARSYSYMKFPYLTRLGPERGWYRVGPLARMNCCDFLDTPLAEAERQEFLALGNGRPVHSTMAYHWARLIESLHAAEKIGELLADPDLQGEDLLAPPGPRREEAVALLEAPRGTLFHHYRVGADDLVQQANLIVSTTSNNEAMNMAVRRVAEESLSGRQVTDALLNQIEVAVRAFDPCLSCATHALGQMPMDLTLLGPDGETLAHRVR